MFSIARFTGEEENDSRSFDKKQERLEKLNARIKNKKRKETPNDDSSKDVSEKKKIKTNVQIDEKDEESIVEKKKDKKERRQSKVVEQELVAVEEEQEQEQEPESQEKSTNDTVDNDAEEMEIDETKEDGPILEAFPEMVLPKTKHSKEDKQLLKNMGIPEWLLRPTVISPKESCELDKVGLSSPIVERCQSLGLSSFFAVQKAVIPVFLRRKTLYDTKRVPGDLCISAPTGSGKTMAYVLPIVDILSKRIVTRLRAVVVLPTRDLVSQVKETFDAFVKGTNLVVAAASGQQSFAHEQRVLVGADSQHQSYAGGKSRVDILVTTPGRLIDHLTSTPNFTLQHLRFLVIDEADRLLNQSYNDWLNRILLATRPEANLEAPLIDFKYNKHNVVEADAIAPSFIKTAYQIPSTDFDLPKMPSVQKLLFSATLTKNPAKIADLHLNNPKYISVQNEDGSQANQEYTTPEGLKEYMTVCPTDKKPLMVIYLLHQLGIKSGLCFTKSVESTQKLQMLLEAYEATQPEEKRIRVKEYSSELGPVKRKQMLKQFKDGQIDLLICSDLIGRGIDLDSVQFVISYDVPYYMDKYIHRVGRTARAGREGEAYTLVEAQEARHFKEMLRHAGHLSQVKPLTIEKEKLKELVPDYKKAISSFASGE
ncbi:MAG: P-loop containing nucleoside triphosphate hydrolase protein [Benjaminiella poitrasii]|nr:MAG: P-loop containing nucleoside triphosphate hydrolase protein [Benjaminiella poitrasii]